MGFTDYVDTPFQPFILPIIPAGAPLSPGSKIQPESLGKIPGFRGENGWHGLKGWTEYRNRRADILKRFDTWYTERAAPTVAINSRELLGIDVDFDHAEAAEIIRYCAFEMLPVGAPVRSRSNSTKLLLCYRLDFKRTSRLVRKIRRVFEDADGERHAFEILGEGQQWLMEGEHPSGVLYAWERAERPVDVGWDNIPAVTADEIDAFVNEVTGRLTAAGFKLIKGGTGMPGGALSGPRIPVGPDHPDVCPDLGMLRDVLTNYLPCDHDEFVTYDEWAIMCIAIVTACGKDEEFYEVFFEWNSRE